jgi:hypothetical protein
MKPKLPETLLNPTPAAPDSSRGGCRSGGSHCQRNAVLGRAGKSIKYVLLMVALTGLTSGCLSPQPAETRTVRGVLRHYPSSVKSVQAWFGHNFMVDETPILPTGTVPEETLRQHVGSTVIITGVWNPGRCWTPSAEEKDAQRPVFPENKIVIVGDGLEASSITPVNQ